MARVSQHFRHGLEGANPSDLMSLLFKAMIMSKPIRNSDLKPEPPPAEYGLLRMKVSVI